ncbi:MAG: glycosyltransferase [Humidesulfovibrio sp.]|nr:glycosyltransferase [Humidesulfovibrio sp.]
MKICSISMRVGAALQDLGHEVQCFWPREPLFDLQAALAERSFRPDLIFQEESLGQRVVLQGLEQFACPKVFWSLDTHVNLFWQAHYFRLFDGVLTPHLGILQNTLRPPHPPYARLAMFGADRPFRPFSQRTHDVGFVGRMTEHRPLRRWLAEFLEQHSKARLAQDISFADMLDLYCDCRLAPNESLLSEVNFRLLEAASCGCLVLSQNVGPDQDALFSSGAEIETYAHVLELKALLDHYKARPEQAERLGRAAWERVQREHLVRHRCHSILEFSAGLAPAKQRQDDPQTANWLTLAQLQRAGMFTCPVEDLAQALGRLPPTPEAVAALITLLAENRRKDAALAALYRLLADGTHPAQLDVNLAGSLAGIYLDDWSLAKQFWYRHAASKPAGRTEVKTPAQLCLLWARELVGAGRLGSSGFPFDPGAHLPKAAVECLYLAQRLDPENLETARRLAALTSTLPGHDFIQLGHLSHLALHAPKDWRTSLQLGLTNLRAFRMSVGLEEIQMARESARSQGKADSFVRMLGALDPKGQVLAALDQVPKPA